MLFQRKVALARGLSHFQGRKCNLKVRGEVRTLKAIMAWSTGKDSALALHRVLEEGRLELHALLTTVSEEFDRVSMHGVRREQAVRQADALGLDLIEIRLPSTCTQETYDEIMRGALEQARSEGVTSVVFGDLFLEDIRAYRERQLAGIGMEAIFPLWGTDTRELAEEMIETGVRALVTCVDTEQLDGSFLGRQFDRAFLESLPAGVDPCGENGEFHTYCWSSPDFKEAVECTPGEIVLREDRFRFLDLLP
jgi:uncharacterized protein (TIGR00290 family)